MQNLHIWKICVYTNLGHMYTALSLTWLGIMTAFTLEREAHRKLHIMLHHENVTGLQLNLLLLSA